MVKAIKSASRLCQGEGMNAQMSSGMHLLLLLAVILSCQGCPEKCTCSFQTVQCQNQDLDVIPHPIPVNTTFLWITGNNIPNINQDSFPARLELLTDLYLNGNDLEAVEEMVFQNLPNLERLDLSNNKIQTFSENAFPDGTFTGLSNLVNLNLRNSSVISISSEILKVPPLRDLDLRDNSLRNLPGNTLTELNFKSDLHVRLAGNPWRCDCLIEDMLVWLKNSTQVTDTKSLTCADPVRLSRRPLVQVQTSQLKCSGNMEGVLETSYVFLGLVLALIGVIFLLVLYLNRKGIKRWMYNIRDACRDHMEGYHYRYEINSDPRLANLSINSDV
ncbi:trophoblast glycoprotein isoform X2 [Nerophis lumbriciformis]|uniref:trophoblast glycoprotein isoform X2 n=1 Tax=Nerophis lumbriciformis TaxID=546530 RepID=UPI002ADF7EDA|nr:trophoblast glycoprotein-like isoform X2 [Nerophis lumbriciformis]